MDCTIHEAHVLHTLICDLYCTDYCNLNFVDGHKPCQSISCVFGFCNETSEDTRGYTCSCWYDYEGAQCGKKIFRCKGRNKADYLPHVSRFLNFFRP